MSAPRGWEGLRAAFLARIEARDWPPGSLIPPETELAREFGCARATVNRALQSLAEAGLVERRRRAGTRVALLPVRRATLDIPVIRREVEARGGAYSFALALGARAPAPPAIAARLGLAAGAELLHLQTLHLADGRPHAWEDRWLNPAVLPPGAEAAFATLSVNEWLVANLAFTEGEIAFSAAAAGPAEAGALGLVEGAPLFVTERVTRLGTQPVTCVRLCHPPGYTMRTAL